MLFRFLFASLICSALPAWSAPAAWTSPAMMCRISDTAINEASGIAVSRRNNGIIYMHNDSGDSARVFAVGKDGQTKAVITLSGVTVNDCEDMAVAYDAECKPTVYMADTGDNGKSRTEVCIYAFEEPLIAPDGSSAPLSVMPKKLRFKYPDGPRDCETLMADFKGRALYVVSKETGPAANVYRLNPLWDDTLQIAVKTGTITLSDPLPYYPNLATGGDISPDGSRIILRTYQQAYEFRVARGKLPENALKTTPAVVRIAVESQGEAICYGRDNRTLLTVSEGVNPTVYSLKWKDPSQ
jgi:hypothetical protein